MRAKLDVQRSAARWCRARRATPTRARQRRRPAWPPVASATARTAAAARPNARLSRPRPAPPWAAARPAAPAAIPTRAAPGPDGGRSDFHDVLTAAGSLPTGPVRAPNVPPRRSLRAGRRGRVGSRADGEDDCWRFAPAPTPIAAASAVGRRGAPRRRRRRPERRRERPGRRRSWRERARGPGRRWSSSSPGSHSQVEVSQRSGLGSGQLKQQGLLSQHAVSPGVQKHEGGPRHWTAQSVGAEQKKQPGWLTLNVSLYPVGQRPPDEGCACADTARTSRSTVAIAIRITVIPLRSLACSRQSPLSSIETVVKQRIDKDRPSALMSPPDRMRSQARRDACAAQTAVTTTRPCRSIARSAAAASTNGAPPAARRAVRRPSTAPSAARACRCAAPRRRGRRSQPVPKGKRNGARSRSCSATWWDRRPSPSSSIPRNSAPPSVCSCAPAPR